MVGYVEPLVALTEEIAGINARDRVRVFARDAQSLDIILDGIGGPAGAGPRPMLCIGAGGAAIALMLAMRLDIAGTLAAQRPIIRAGQAARGPLTIVGRDQESLDNVRAVRDRCGIPAGGAGLMLGAPRSRNRGRYRTTRRSPPAADSPTATDARSGGKDPVPDVAELAEEAFRVGRI
jgi:hypothetical protein